MTPSTAEMPLDPPDERVDSEAPVRFIPGDAVEEAPREGIALCLSGGGYRAMLFHLGTLWRLHELGYLGQLTRVSSVSGGSITAAVLGLAWGRLELDSGGSNEVFKEEVVKPIRKLAGKTIDTPSVLAGGLLPGTTIGDRIAAAYRSHLLGDATLQDLPGEEGPRFVINATNLQSGVLWRFSRPYMRDYRVGKIEWPQLSLATAVAASSAFPPVLCPMRLRFDEDQYVPRTGDDLQRPPFTTNPTLGDGGIYDNLGLETAWKRCKTVLVSDGGGAMPADCGKLGPLPNWRWRDWGSQTVRVLKVVDNQVRSLRKRQAIAGYKATQGSKEHREGTYWGIRGHVADYELGSSLPAPPKETRKLAEVPTRLAKLDDATQERLINWGYAICDTAMRRWVVGENAGKPQWPYQENALGVSSGSD
ncbi:MAG TPA: patatin-like phospholipase family protein [Solirubrobacterales bacterium]|nr:patatin-like phospholipase family protein [Solirubrobacterales bacterium]